MILFVQPSPIQEQIPRLLIECVQFREGLQLVWPQCYYSYELCLDDSPQDFLVLFEVLADVTEGLKYSLPARVVWPQCYHSYELCLDGSPQVLLVLF